MGDHAGSASAVSFFFSKSKKFEKTLSQEKIKKKCKVKKNDKKTQSQEYGEYGGIKKGDYKGDYKGEIKKVKKNAKTRGKNAKTRGEKPKKKFPKNPPSKLTPKITTLKSTTSLSRFRVFDPNFQNFRCAQRATPTPPKFFRGGGRAKK